MKKSIDALRQDIKQTLSEIEQQLAQGPGGGPSPGMPWPFQPPPGCWGTPAR